MFLLWFLIIMTLFLTLLSLLSNNIIMWWSIFLMMTVIFVMINKSTKSYGSIINYFIIQESLGLIFLLFSVMYYQYIIILLKVGVSPFHFWVFSVISNMYNFNLLWFLTFQKLPFLVILLQMFWLNSVILLFFGLFVCYLQMFLLKSYKNLLVISSTESFSWIIIGLFFSFFNSLYLFFYYALLMMLLIVKFSKQNLSFFNWESTLVFLNLPYSVSFFVKIFSLSEIMNVDNILILMMLFMMFLSILSFSFWLINLSMKNNDMIQNNSKLIYFLSMPLMILSII